VNSYEKRKYSLTRKDLRERDIILSIFLVQITNRTRPLERLPSNPWARQCRINGNSRHHQENGCRICPKIFCCSECRDIHENRKHPNSKCSLCVKQDLPYKSLLNPELHKNSEFFCHVAFNHLPLGCKLCGDRYTSVQDLLTAQSCRYAIYQLVNPSFLPRQLYVLTNGVVFMGGDFWLF
jgi:hypothetical protein